LPFSFFIWTIMNVRCRSGRSCFLYDSPRRSRPRSPVIFFDFGFYRFFSGWWNGEHWASSPFPVLSGKPNLARRPFFSSLPAPVLFSFLSFYAQEPSYGSTPPPLPISLSLNIVSPLVFFLWGVWLCLFFFFFWYASVSLEIGSNTSPILFRL